MASRLRLSDLVPGLVIAGGRRTVTEPEIRDFADRFGSTRDDGGRASPARRGKASAVTASGWLICTIAEQLAATAVATSCRVRFSGPRDCGPLGLVRRSALLHPSKNVAGGDCWFELTTVLLSIALTRTGKPLSSKRMQVRGAEVTTNHVVAVAGGRGSRLRGGSGFAQQGRTSNDSVSQSS